MAPDFSQWMPGFLRQLAAPSVRNVLLCGCGGGFDFVHAAALISLLRAAGKNVVVGSGARAR